MKSINQIFEDDKDLMNNHKVIELIEYTKELENQIVEVKQGKIYNLENELSEVVRDIYSSCEVELENDFNAIRFGESEKVDFEECIRNLRNFIGNFARDNNFRL